VGAAADQPGRDAGHARCSSSGPGSGSSPGSGAHPEVIELVYRCLVRNGMDRFVVLDPSHDMDAGGGPTARVAKKGGRQRGHRGTDLHDLRGARRRVLRGHRGAVRRLQRHRPRPTSRTRRGILTPDRARTLIPAVQAALGGKPLELQLARPRSGFPSSPAWSRPSSACTCSRSGAAPSATGSSLPVRPSSWSPTCAPPGTPSTSTTGCCPPSPGTSTGSRRPRGSRRAGRAPSTRRFMDHPASAGGGHVDDQAGSWPRSALGGPVSTRSWPRSPRCGAELGYPIMVTPYPQMVIGQAVANLLSAQAGNARYDNVPDQVIRYALGTFGKPNRAGRAVGCSTKVLGRPRAAELANERPPLDVAELRARFRERGISDEEAGAALRDAGPPKVDAMVAAGPRGHPLQTRTRCRYSSCSGRWRAGPRRGS